MAHTLPYFNSVRVTASDCPADFPTGLLPCLPGYFHSPDALSTRVPTVLSYSSTGISTCCPSATRFRLALGPDLPGADQLYPGNLGYSALKILTLISLLIPAFSLDGSPRLLAGTASMCRQCSSTNTAYPAHNRRFLKGFPFGISSAAIRRIDDIPLLRWRV